MNNDLKLKVGENILNIRVGIILRYNKEVVLEISKIGDNSAVPGGRVKFNENSFDAIIREIKEEMNMELERDKIKKVDTFENFFKGGTISYHEIFFLYDYTLSENEYEYIKNLGNNKDNINTYFEMVSNDRLEEVDLLPTLLYDIIRK